MIDFYSKILELLKENKDIVQISVIDKAGSIPAKVGSKLIVTKNGFEAGTVGGGSLEKKAIDYALEMLENKAIVNEIVEWNLSKDLAMACGGSVKLLFETISPNSLPVVIFGAGHVANALSRILITLNCSITCVDYRQEWLEKLPLSYKIKPVLAEDMAEYVEKVPENSFVIVMTTSHELDWAITEKCLKKDFSYLGLMGSKRKKAWLEEKIIEAGFDKDYIDKIHCPLGLPIGNNEPAEIAVSITAQILKERDRL